MIDFVVVCTEFDQEKRNCTRNSRKIPEDGEILAHTDRNIFVF